MRSARSKAIGAVILATLAWGSTPVFIKIFSDPSRLEAFAGVEAMDPFTQTVGRYGVALAMLLLFGLFKRNMRIDRLKRRWWRLMLIPSVPNVVMQVCWVGAFYYLMPTMASLLAKLATILSLAFTYLFFRDERGLIGSWHFLIAAVLAVGAAVGLTLSSENLEVGTIGIGALFVVGSSTFWALYSVGIKFVMRRTEGHERMPSGAAFVIAAVYMVAAFAIMTALWGDYGKFARIGWAMNALLVLSGTLNIAIPHILYYYSIRTIGVAVTALVTMCTTFITATASYLVFGETLTWVQIVFGVILMGSAAAAVWLSRRNRRSAGKLPLREPPID